MAIFNVFNSELWNYQRVHLFTKHESETSKIHGFMFDKHWSQDNGAVLAIQKACNNQRYGSFDYWNIAQMIHVGRLWGKYR